MNIEQIKEAFDECRHVTTAHWVHGLYVGRTIEQGTYFELIATIDQLREDTIVRVKKAQQAASEESGGVSSHE